MLVKFSILLVLVFSLSSGAADSNSEFSLKAGERLVVSVTEAQINVVASPTTKAVKILFPDGGSAADFQIEKRDGILELRSRDQLTKSEFGKPNSQLAGKKHKEIEILLPSLNPPGVELHLLEGTVSLTRFSKEALLQVLKGKILVKDCQGASLHINIQRGEVLIQDSQGKLNLDSYAAATTLKNFNGDVELQNFSGETLIEKNRGFLNLNQVAGNTRIIGSSGGLQFDLGKGIITTQQFAGRIDGQSNEGSVNLTLSPESDVNIKAQSGKVTIQSASNSGSMLNVSTAEGEIYGPSYLKVGRDSSGKSLKGRIKGEQQKSTIIVRGQETVIVIK